MTVLGQPRVDSVEDPGGGCLGAGPVLDAAGAGAGCVHQVRGRGALQRVLAQHLQLGHLLSLGGGHTVLGDLVCFFYETFGSLLKFHKIIAR